MSCSKVENYIDNAYCQVTRSNYHKEACMGCSVARMICGARGSTKGGMAQQMGA